MVTQLVKATTQRRIPVPGSRVLVIGPSFKQNCPDLHNTSVVDIVREFGEYDVRADVYDPWVSAEEARHAYGITPVHQPEASAYHGIILAVAHRDFKAVGAGAIRALGRAGHVLFDLKYILPAQDSDLCL